MSRTKTTNVVLPGTLVEPTSLVFSLYTAHEIRKLSVAEIRTPLLFDAVGVPLPSGLHDPFLGATEDRSEPCKTCKATFYLCPGHMGHIELPLPVINPLFYKTVYALVQITCKECSTVRLQGPQKYLFILQMKLLEAGYAKEAREAESLVSEEETSDVLDEAQVIRVRQTLDKYYEHVIKSGSNSEEENKRFIDCKTIQSIRNSLITSLSKKYVAISKPCIGCKGTMRTYKQVFSKLFVRSPVLGTAIIEGSRSTQVVVTVHEIRSILRDLWKKESEFVSAFAPSLKKIKSKHPTDALFMTTIPVLPIRARPVGRIGGKLNIHPQTVGYKPIVEATMILRNILKEMKGGEGEQTMEGKTLTTSVKGESLEEKMILSWQSLQVHIDHLMDTELNPLSRFSASKSTIGLKQVMEKKEGVIRMNMMGKRVNYAARSVITPDPNLEIEEIGVPEAFALALTYPTPVTSWNVAELRKMIINGPLVHPGAVKVENENGQLINIPAYEVLKRESLAKQLLTPGEKSDGPLKGVKVVHRHLKNGDVLLLNRQPTLHRPSIMAHKARVLKGERTFRLNYANCKAYNADFDGDEMNAHFPQNEIARSEAYNLVNVCNNYLVPKDGTPLSGLIQDHVIAAVNITLRGRFFNREDYCQLTYQALNTNTHSLRLVRPAILKPEPLWSGKQIITTILINIIPLKKHRLHLQSSSKISAKAWQNQEPRKWKAGGTPFKRGNSMSEAEVIIRDGELLCGVLDKTHYGATPYGLVHCLYELYGGKCSSQLLSAFSKLSTYFLQLEGFTLGVEDILVVEDADECRSKAIKRARLVGDEAVASALDLVDPDQETLKAKLEHALSTNKAKYRTLIDRSYKTVLDEYTNQINRACLPAGLLKTFPKNNLQLMVQSGAKGSTVNTMQISCLLGQIELEGKRPPLMPSGKSLPSFLRFDTSPRAGGFIDGRFLTGIQPQEFFFHCMAGREGLIDTAVKTSRSGYLQRCLVKHLEGLTVQYDQTVRDSDGSVIQFYYGEDGVEVSKAQFLNTKQVPFLVDNFSTLDPQEAKSLMEGENYEKIRKIQRKISRWQGNYDPSEPKRKSAFTKFSVDRRKEFPEEMFKEFEAGMGRSKADLAMTDLWFNADRKTRKRYEKQVKRCPDTVTSEFRSDTCFGAVTERIENLISDYLKSQPKQDTRLKQKYDDSQELMFLKSMRSQCHAGEPVGLLAAQSIGEPSTQMTLNTFHFAGRGDMNVTLGIPRLREILMVASKSMKTPSMDIPFRSDVANVEKKAEDLRKKLTRVLLSDVLETITVDNFIELEPTRSQASMLNFNFIQHKLYKDKYAVTPKYIIAYMEKEFIIALLAVIKKRATSTKVLVHLDTDALKIGNENEEDVDEPEQPKEVALDMGEGHNSSDEEEAAEDEDAAGTKLRTRHEEGQEYEDPDPEETEMLKDDDSNEGVEEDARPKSPEDVIKSATTIEGGKPKHSNVQPSTTELQLRVRNVINKSPLISDYDFDTEHNLWCRIKLSMPFDLKKIDFSTILKEVAEHCVIWQVPFIKRAFLYNATDNKQLMFKTDGINIGEMCKYLKLLDLRRLYTNDIHSVAYTYGIEAARKVIVKEVQDVFNMYGITVDPRHLLLIADYMTFNGGIEALNRLGMESSVSPLQQMTFESALQFLRSATIGGKRDHLESPSSRLMIGRPAKGGTGIFQIFQSLDNLGGSPNTKVTETLTGEDD